MVFSSTVFLFIFLPSVLFLYVLFPARFRNILLLIASLFFYAWGENFFVMVMLISIASNYIAGRAILAYKARPFSKAFLIFGIAANLLLLGSYKYVNFIVDNINYILTVIHVNPIQLAQIHLPIGISFFTFQAMSYLIDLYREDAPPQKGLINVALYISLFPQLIAGPIVRYHDIAHQLIKRSVTRDGFACGVRRFVIGLGKKVLIANTVATVADQVFSLPYDQLSTGAFWLGSLCYTLQIYFDFSGYSDMAIGLGRMFGFRIPENFNYPYISTSIREFWRRWHISLSTWFRDYLYFPLGGNRKGQIRTYINLFIVFILCGLWHGASWNFVIWGLIHGLFLSLERTAAGYWIKALWRPFKYLYVLLVVIVAWVFFRCETLSDAITYLSHMFAIDIIEVPAYTVAYFLNREVLSAMLLGCIGATPVLHLFVRINKYIRESAAPLADVYRIGFSFSRTLCLSLILLLSIMYLASGAYNPFIYFRF